VPDFLRASAGIAAYAGLKSAACHLISPVLKIPKQNTTTGHVISSCTASGRVPLGAGIDKPSLSNTILREPLSLEGIVS